MPGAWSEAEYEQQGSETEKCEATEEQQKVTSATGMSDTTGSRMARVPPLHRTKSAVSTPKNLRLPPNLKVETTTSWNTS